MRHNDKAAQVARLHPSFEADARILETALSRGQVERVAMMRPDQATALLNLYRGQIKQNRRLSKQGQEAALAALTRLGKARPLTPPIEVILPAKFLDPLRKGNGIELMPILRQAGEYIRNLKLHPVVQSRSLDGIRALADSVAVA